MILKKTALPLPEGCCMYDLKKNRALPLPEGCCMCMSPASVISSFRYAEEGMRRRLSAIR